MFGFAPGFWFPGVLDPGALGFVVFGFVLGAVFGVVPGVVPFGFVVFGAVPGVAPFGLFELGLLELGFVPAPGAPGWDCVPAPGACPGVVPPGFADPGFAEPGFVDPGVPL